jgi:hypothetical protein
MKTMKTYKICVVTLLLMSAFFFLLVSTVFAADSTATVEEKLSVFLSDVLEIDLAKYTIINKGGGIKYPSELGGIVKEESFAIRYNSTDSQIDASVVFRNGYIYWLHVRPTHGSIIYYSRQPSTSAVAQTRNILEKYETFAEKYGINTAHVSSALSLLDQASDGPSPSGSLNFNGISGFNPINATS